MRENTRRSLMPEGFEALGAEALRDILTRSSPAGDQQKFRDRRLRKAYTARQPPRASAARTNATRRCTLHRFGDVTVAGVPFFVMDPATLAERHQPDCAEGRTRHAATSRTSSRSGSRSRSTASPRSLHFLGGVGGWAWPIGGDAARGKPAMKVVVQFADGATEEHVLKNGEHVRRRASRAPTCR